MLHNELHNLGELLAASHIDIQHNVNGRKAYFRVSVDELMSGIQLSSSGFIMAGEMETSRINDQRSDNRLDIKEWAFNILHSVQPNDFKDIRLKISQCEAIARQCIANLRRMSLAKNQENDIVQLDLEHVEFIPVGPEVYMSRCGCRASLRLVTKEPNNYYDATKWV